EPDDPKKAKRSSTDVKSFPLWFSGFQNHLTDNSSWGEDERSVQALLEAFLRARTPNAPANVLEFYRHVGKSEVNKQSGDLAAGSVGAENWCQQASTQAVVRGLEANGLRFKPRQSPRTLSWLN